MKMKIIFFVSFLPVIYRSGNIIYIFNNQSIPDITLILNQRSMFNNVSKFPAYKEWTEHTHAGFLGIHNALTQYIIHLTIIYYSSSIYMYIM